MTSASKILTKSLKSPDETLTFEKEKIEIVNWETLLLQE